MDIYRSTLRQNKLLYMFSLVSGLFFLYILWLESSATSSTLRNVPYYSQDDELLLSSPNQLLPVQMQPKPCTMHTCFDFTKCDDQFKVYIYPSKEKAKISLNYAKILKSVFRSRYYTEDPKQACLFLPSLDPLDRDRLSTNYQKKLEKNLKSLPYWNNGENHLIFNHYSGTYPDYKDILDMDTDKAILVKASVSSESFRRNFDISLPLFSRIHPISAAGHLPSSVHIFPFRKKYGVSFKGKRYLKGIGSETRNAIYKLHNGHDMILLTTCKHGKKWREIQDRRCSKDNELYERYDYQELLHNSTFCLTPRGRRLGSYRFLESLSVSCIPVSLANGYELPFSEVIDWKKALVNVDERQFFEVGLILEAISDMQVALYRQQNQFLWEAYFSSVEKIVWTVIEIIRHRVQRTTVGAYATWNSFPGALISSKGILEKKPSLHFVSGDEPSPEFTAVLLVKSKKLKKVLELSRNISKANFVNKIVVIWAVGTEIPEKRLWPSKTDIVIVGQMDIRDPSWKPYVKTDAIFFVDNFATVEPEEVNLGFSVWKMFPNRLTGIFAGSHFWNDKISQWSYTTKVGVYHDKGYSMILPSTAFYHRYYDHLYAEYFPKVFQDRVKKYDGCEDISLNFLVAHATRLPPIKILKYDPSRTKQNTAPIKYSVRNACFQLMTNIFGYIPLLYSKVTFVMDNG